MVRISGTGTGGCRIGEIQLSMPTIPLGIPANFLTSIKTTQPERRTLVSNIGRLVSGQR
jgi:hypothetical protein